ncbi:MAG TPA: hypothetical protein VFS92_05450 [Planctomycetota bacterium]|nr:hypothetical protein [Planctomycetota bacterium]
MPIVIFADPSGREIPGTRLDHSKAQVKSTYLEHAKKALDAFRGGRTAEEAKKDWRAYGQALRIRAEGKDPGAGVEMLVALRDAAKKGAAIRDSIDAALRRLDEEEARGLLAVAESDLSGEDFATGIEGLFQVMREFPGLPSAAKAAEAIAKAKADHADAIAKEQKEHDAWLALRAADRLGREGKTAEAKEAWQKVAVAWPGTRAAKEASERIPK